MSNEHGLHAHPPRSTREAACSRTPLRRGAKVYISPSNSCALMLAACRTKLYGSRLKPCKFGGRGRTRRHVGPGTPRLQRTGTDVNAVQAQTYLILKIYSGITAATTQQSSSVQLSLGAA